jgi:hypothetical protein
MGGDFVSMFQLETKRLLWLIGITFAIILSFQYLELMAMFYSLYNQ